MFTIYHTNGAPILSTDNEQLARLSVLRGHRVTRSTFGVEVDVTFGLPPYGPTI